MTKFMRTLMLTGICATVMVSGFAFADDTESAGNGGNRLGQQRVTQEEREAKRAEMQAQREERQAQRDERQVKLMELVETYAPDLVDDFEAAFEEAESLQDEMQAIREANQLTDDEKEAIRAEVEAIREQVQSGEMTIEEAREAIQALKPERPEKPAYSEENKEARKENLAGFKAAIESGDTDAIYDYLLEILERIQDHNEAKADKIDAMDY